MQFEFVVEFSKSPLWGRRVGMSRPDLQTIYIDAEASPAMQRTAFLHEFLHCVSDLLLLDMSEQCVGQLAVFMLPELGLPWSDVALCDMLDRLQNRLKLDLDDNVRASLVEGMMGLVCYAPEVMRWLGNEN